MQYLSTIMSNELGSLAALHGSYNNSGPHRQLHAVPSVRGVSSLMAGSSTTAQQAQQELDSAMGDLLGDADDWDNEEEEDEEEGGREGGGGEQGGGGKTEPANASQARGATRGEVQSKDTAKGTNDQQQSVERGGPQQLSVEKGGSQQLSVEKGGSQQLSVERGGSQQLSVEKGGSQQLSGLSELDDMDAGLFSSFTHNQSHRRRGGGRTKQSTAETAQPSPNTAPPRTTLVDEKQPVSRSPPTSTAGRERPVHNDTTAAQKPVPGKTPQEKLRTSEFDADDLLDLLTDEPEESTSKTKPRPKFQMKPKSSHGTKLKDGTSGKSDSTESGSHTAGRMTEPQHAVEEKLQQMGASGEEEDEWPKSRKGLTEIPQRRSTSAIDSSAPALASTSSGDGLPKSGGEKRGGEGGGRGGTVGRDGKSRGDRASHTSGGVDFGSEDDVLSGLGLDDNDALLKPRNVSSRTQQRGSRVAELLGSASTRSRPKKTKTDLEQASTTGTEIESLKEKAKEKHGNVENGGDEDESYQFGGYLPSVVSGPRRTGLPTSERKPSEAALNRQAPPPRAKESSTMVAIHKPRKSHPERRQEHDPEPHAVSAKKSVHFADETQRETEEPSNAATNASHRPDSDTSTLLNPLQNPQRMGGEIQDGNVRGEKAASKLETQPPAIAESTHRKLSDQGKSTQPKEKEGRLQHPVFPWQQNQRDRGTGASVENLGTSSDHLPVENSESREEVKGRQAVLQSSTGSAADLREQSLTGRQKKREAGGVAKQRTQEFKVELEEERTENKNLKAKVSSLKLQLEVSEQSLAAQLRSAKEEKMELQGSLQGKELQLSSQIEELKAKLHRVELEKDQLRHSMEAAKTHHTEEQEAVQKSHDARVQALEESFQRREARWREELEAEASRQREKLEQMERDKTDSVLALRKKIDSLDVTKANEISRLQEIHRSAVADLKREHELDVQRLKDLHREEIEALKAVHSHTHRLSELSSVVEKATRGVSELQSRVEQAHRVGQQEREQSSQLHQQHLQTLEERLSKQHREVESERQLLQTLVGRLEAHLIQQSRTAETERWNLQQETARLRAGEQALEVERTEFLARMEEQRRALAESKEKFLTEQQRLLSECLSERHSLASERAQLTVQQKKTAEREQMENLKTQEVEVELEVSLTRAREEQARLAAEAARLQLEESRLKADSSHIAREREAVERERESLQKQRADVEHRAEEAEKMRQSAAALHKESEEAMRGAQRLQSELTGQAEALKRESEHLQQRESQLASERLAFARECRELQERKSPFSDFLHPAPEPILASTQRPDRHYSPPPSPPMTSTLAHSLPLRLQSPLCHTQQPASPTTSSIHSALTSLQHTRQLRKVAWDAEKDDLDLQAERQFVESTRQSNSFLLSDYYSKSHTMEH